MIEHQTRSAAPAVQRATTPATTPAARVATAAPVRPVSSPEPLVQRVTEPTVSVDRHVITTPSATRIHRKEAGGAGAGAAQAAAAPTGLPSQLKAGIENLSGISMDDVKVHYNSAKPAQLNAHAYAQGSEIHVAPGQEQHLPHEAWHVVQQKQGRVQPTMHVQGASGNDPKLEAEAASQGAAAAQGPAAGPAAPGAATP